MALFVSFISIVVQDKFFQKLIIIPLRKKIDKILHVFGLVAIAIECFLDSLQFKHKYHLQY